MMMIQNRDNPFKEFQRIGKLSQDGVFVYHIPDNKFLFLNSSLVKIMEVNKKLLLEEPNVILHSILKEDQEYVALRFRELLEKEFLEDVQIRIVQNRVQKVLSCNCYLSQDKQCIMGIIKDISKPKEHEDYLINFGARKDAILDMVSQNLSTPLNLSKFTVDLIEKAVQERKFNKLDAHIGLIREVTAECIKVIDNLIRHEHLVSPDIHIKMNRFDVIGKTSLVLEKRKDAHPDKQFKFRSDAGHLFIDADDLKFLQIVQNLLSNSVKFTRQQGVIETIIKDHKDNVEIIIKDDGIGIPDQLKPYVFEKHTRAGRPGLNGEISNGIGLYVCHKLTRLMGGKLSFESKENKGTKFILQLPKEKEKEKNGNRGAEKK